MQQILNSYLPSIILFILYLWLPYLICKGLKLNKNWHLFIMLIGFFLLKSDLNVFYTQILQTNLNQDNLVSNVFFLSLITYFIPHVIIFTCFRKKYA